MALGDVIARLSVALNLNTASFERDAKRASGTVGRMQATMSKSAGLISAAFTAGAIGGALGNIAANAFEMASSLSEAAEQVGVSVEALQELRFAADQTGVGADKMDATIKRLNKSLGELQLGSKPAVSAFAAIGLSADELRGKSPEKALGIIADALNRLPDASQRVAIGQQIMGRSFSDLLPLINGGSKALNDYAQASRENGQISTQDAAKLDQLADDWDKLKTRVGVATANLIASTSKWLDSVAASQNKFKANVDGFYASIGRALHSFADVVNGAMRSAHASIVALYQGVKTYLVDKLNAIWATVKAKIEAVKGYFFGLYDAVVGHSYVPDMVDEIAAQMQRLDAVMVAPAASAAERTKQTFQKLQDDVRGIMDDLFPDAREIADFGNQRDALQAGINAGGAGGYTKEQLQEGLNRLYGNALSPMVEGVGSTIWNGLSDALGKVTDKLGTFHEKAKVTTVAISKSFKDMADATIQSLNNLSNSIKSGGFLNILTSVIGLGLQLGSVGLFGKTIAGRLNAPIPGNANGTANWRGGLTMVGERGPELVNLPRGSRIWPNGEGPGGGGRAGGNTYNFSGNLLTPEFWAMIQRGDERAATAGAGLAQSRIATSRQWSLA